MVNQNHSAEVRDGAWSRFGRFVATAAMVTLLVTACGGGGGGGGDVDSGPPTAPENVSAEPVNGRMVVSWTHDGARVSEFRISREAAAAATGLVQMAAEELATVDSGAREFTDRTAEIGTEYVYSVVASGADGTSGAAAAAPSTVGQGAALSVGINIWGDEVRVQCVVAAWFKPGSEPQDPLDFTVTRPDGAELAMKLPVWVAEDGPYLVGCGNIVPASLGEYSLSILMPGDDDATVLTATLHDLELPELPQLDVELREGTAVASWNTVAGVASYVVSLYSVSGDFYVFFVDTLDTKHEFGIVGLAPGEYEVMLTSYPTDRVSPGRPGLPARYDLTSVKESFNIADPE